MDRKQIGVKLTMDALESDFKIDSFNDRLILQKTVYLAQAAGVHLGYFPRWYLHGPYCPELTTDAFEITSEIKAKMDDSNKWALDNASLSKLKRIKSIFSGLKGQQLADKLELLASVHFLIDRKQVKGKNIKEIYQILKRYKKPFTETQVGDALRELEHYALLG